MADAPVHPLLETFAAERCSAILRTPHADAVAPAMQAAVDAGFRIVEFTLTCPDALRHVADFAATDGLTVGAGTVLTVADARRALDAGARFLVSPVADDEVIRYAVDAGALMVPGVFTPNEMLRAWRAGAQVLKLFPGPPDGPAFLRACRGPMPFLRVFPTSGVTLANVKDYFAAGAFGVGWVNDLFAADDLAAGRFEAVRERAARMLAATREAAG